MAYGRRCFIKAVSSAQNPEAPELYRRQVRVAAALPAGLPVAEFKGTVDDGEWVALVFDEVDGQPPPLPWTIERLASAFDALDVLHGSLTPCTVGVPSIGAQYASAFEGFAVWLKQGPPPGPRSTSGRRATSTGSPPLRPGGLKRRAARRCCTPTCATTTCSSAPTAGRLHRLGPRQCRRGVGGQGALPSISRPERPAAE